MPRRWKLKLDEFFFALSPLGEGWGEGLSGLKFDRMSSLVNTMHV
jgi:hypothetical protein